MFCNVGSVKMYAEIVRKADGLTNELCTNERREFADEYEMQTLRVDELRFGLCPQPDAEARAS